MLGVVTASSLVRRHFSCNHRRRPGQQTVDRGSAWNQPDLLDYDTSFKSAGQDAIYAPDAYRSSDHDPVIVGLDTCDEIAPTFDVLRVTPNVLFPPDHCYVDVSAVVEVSDDFDDSSAVRLVQVSRTSRTTARRTATRSTTGGRDGDGAPVRHLVTEPAQRRR